MKISGSGASYSLRRCSTCRAMMSRKRQPAAHAQQRLGAVHAHRGAEAAVELDHRGPADRLGGDVVGHLDVGQRLHVERLDRRLGDHPGLAVLEQPVVVREGVDGDGVDAGVLHLGARDLEAIATHALDRRLTACQRNSPSPPSPPAKGALRDQLLTARRRRPLAEVGGRARAIAEHLLASGAYAARRPSRRTSRSAASPAPDCCSTRCSRREAGAAAGGAPDLDLDWATYTGPRAGLRARRGLLEPAAPAARRRRDRDRRRGARARAGRVAATGDRLGRGGGCYDRALARVPVGTFTCVLLHDDEVGRDVPTEPHDRPVAPPSPPSVIARVAGSWPRVSPSSPRRSTGASAAVGGPACTGVERVVAAAPRPRRGVNAHGRVSPFRRQVGLVVVVVVDRVPGDAGQVDPARVVEVGRVETTIRIDGAAGDGVALGGVPAGRVDDARAAADSQPSRLTSHSIGADARLAQRRAAQVEPVQVAPASTRRRRAPAARSARRGASIIACRRMSSRVSTTSSVVTSSHHGSGRRRRAGRSTTANQRSPPFGQMRSRSSSWKVSRSRLLHTTLKYAAAPLSTLSWKSQSCEQQLAVAVVAARQVLDVEQVRHQRRRHRVVLVELELRHLARPTGRPRPRSGRGSAASGSRGPSRR